MTMFEMDFYSSSIYKRMKTDYVYRFNFSIKKTINNEYDQLFKIFTTLIFYYQTIVQPLLCELKIHSKVKLKLQ